MEMQKNSGTTVLKIQKPNIPKKFIIMSFVCVKVNYTYVHIYINIPKAFIVSPMQDTSQNDSLINI